MAGKPSKGLFTPKNPQKYLGNAKDIIFRSSWELSTMLFLDNSQSVQGWMSEGLPTNHVHNGLSGIPYQNPLTGRWSIYVPDFFVIYVDRKNKQHVEVMEIKPTDEVPGYIGDVSQIKSGRQMINAAKFTAALKFCATRGWFFRVITEKDLFAHKGRPL